MSSIVQGFSGSQQIPAAQTLYADRPSGSGLAPIAADGTTDDGPALVAQLAYIKSTWGSGRLVLPAGKTIRCGPMGTLPTKVQIEGLPGTTLYFSGLTGTQTAMSVSDHDFIPLSKLSLRGPGKTSTTTGLSIAGSGNVFDHISVYQFGTDVNLNNPDTYINKFEGGSLGDATLCVKLDINATSTSNAGERNVFTGVTFFNSDKAVLLDSGGGSTIFYDCSFDYCVRFGDLFSGHAYFSGCHFESADTVSTSGYLFNANFNSVTTFDGCRFILAKFGSGGLRWIVNPGQGPWNYGFGRISFGRGNRAFFFDSGGSGRNVSSDELMFIGSGLTAATMENPFVHKWGPVTAMPGCNDGAAPQAGITVRPSTNVSAGTVTVTASSAPTSDLPVRVQF